MLAAIIASLFFILPTLTIAERPKYPARAVSKPIPFKPDAIDPEHTHSATHPRSDTKECPSGQVSFCVALPRNKSCSLACDKPCDPKCPEGSHPVVIDCKTVCIKKSKVAKGRNVCGEKFERFMCAQETSARVPATGCECPTTSQSIGDVSDSDSCSDRDSSSSDSFPSNEFGSSSEESESDYSSDSSDESDSDSYSSESSDESHSDYSSSSVI